MKLICPHCGLKGTADEALLDKKVRCPQCQKIFRLSETDAIPARSVPLEVTATDQPESTGEEVQRQPMHVEIPSSEVVQQPGTVPVPEVGICSSCGFSLSLNYLEEKDAKLYCRICLPA